MDQGRRFGDKESKVQEDALSKAFSEFKGYTEARFADGSDRIKSLQFNLDANTRLTTELATRVDNRFDNLDAKLTDVLKFSEAVEGTKRTIGWGGKAFIWLASIAGAFTVFKGFLSQNVKLPWQ